MQSSAIADKPDPPEHQRSFATQLTEPGPKPYRADLFRSANLDTNALLRGLGKECGRDRNWQTDNFAAAH